jgi:chromosome segregation ATPase
MVKAVKTAEETDAAVEESPALAQLLVAKGEYRSVKAQAFRELQWFSRRLLGVMLLADDLAGVASLDEVRADIVRQRDEAFAEHADLVAEIARRRDEVDTLKAQIDELTIEAEGVRDRIIADGRQQAAELIRESRAAGERLFAEACASNAAEAERHAEEARARQVVIEDMRAQIAQLDADIIDRTNTRNAIEGEISALRARFGG